MTRTLTALAALLLALTALAVPAAATDPDSRPDDLVTVTDYPPVLVECDVVETRVTVTVVGHEWDGTAWVPLAPVETTSTSQSQVTEAEVLVLGLPFECSDDEPTPAEPAPGAPAAPASPVPAAPTFAG